MNTLKHLMTVAIGGLLLGVVYGQGLWAGTEAGMTPEEVLALVPNAKLAADTTGPEKWPDMANLVEVDSVDVLGVIGEARFGFIDDKLVRVSLGFVPELDRFAGERQCAQFKAALRGRYGQEGASEEGPVVLGMSIESYVWFSDLTEIELSCVVTPNSAIYVITYHYIESAGL